MADRAESQAGLTKGARITGDQRSTLGEAFGQRYAGGESIRSIAEDTGRSYGFVHGVLKESGATLRGRGGATRGPRRTPVDKVAGQLAAAAPATAPAPVVARANAEKAERSEKPDKAGKADKADKAGKAKSAKDDKAKKKAPEPKKGKKSKKG